MSEYLLDSFNDHSRPPRFGALVLNDTLHVRLLASPDPNPTPNPNPNPT